ncbi:MAG: DUF3093 domain-containing protein [Microbacteriaceae bacterium]|nr:DUF3093 domain-containing protein [Microbacteriaceae bacterium]
MTIYRERLWVSIGVLLAVALVIPAAILVFLPINPTVGVLTGVAIFLVIGALLVYTSPRLEVTDTEFRAGGARVPRSLIGRVEAFREPEATVQRGLKLDARAWLLIRGWIGPVVKVELNDPRDPTPYWLISTRKPEELARALSES